MDRERLIDLVRREHGVVLDQSDPVLAVATVARAASEEDRAAVREMLTEMRQVAAEMSRAGVLSPESESRLIDRVAAAVPPAVQRSLVSWHRWVDRKAALAVGAAGLTLLLAGLAGGYWWGRSAARADIRQTETGLATAFANGPEAAREWWSLMAWNDPRKALANCKVRVDGGRRACDLPMWIEGPQAPGQGR